MLPINRIQRASGYLEERVDWLSVAILLTQLIKRSRELSGSDLCRREVPGQFTEPDHGLAHISEIARTNCFDAVATTAKLVDRMRRHTTLPNQQQVWLQQ